MRAQAPVVVSASYDVEELYLRIDRDSELVEDDTADRLLETLSRAVRERLAAVG
jgi:hypothetical protein